MTPILLLYEEIDFTLSKTKTMITLKYSISFSNDKPELFIGRIYHVLFLNLLLDSC